MTENQKIKNEGESVYTLHTPSSSSGSKEASREGTLCPRNVPYVYNQTHWPAQEATLFIELLTLWNITTVVISVFITNVLKSSVKDDEFHVVS